LSSTIADRVLLVALQEGRALPAVHAHGDFVHLAAPGVVEGIRMQPGAPARVGAGPHGGTVRRLHGDFGVGHHGAACIAHLQQVALADVALAVDDLGAAAEGQVFAEVGVVVDHAGGDRLVGGACGLHRRAVGRTGGRRGRQCHRRGRGFRNGSGSSRGRRSRRGNKGRGRRRGRRFAGGGAIGLGTAGRRGRSGFAQGIGPGHLIARRIGERGPSAFQPGLSRAGRLVGLDRPRAMRGRRRLEIGHGLLHHR
jgi:hypothetical protein